MYELAESRVQSVGHADSATGSASVSSALVEVAERRGGGGGIGERNRHGPLASLMHADPGYAFPVTDPIFAAHRGAAMTSRTIPPAPTDLSDTSRARWPGLAADVAATMGGAEADFLALANVLRAEDRLATVRTVLDAEGPTVTGSRGQTRPHPLLVSEAVLRREIATGLDRLGFGFRDRWRVRVARGGRLVKDSDE